VGNSSQLELTVCAGSTVRRGVAVGRAEEDNGTLEEVTSIISRW
jgi:hypothetical protein